MAYSAPNPMNFNLLDGAYTFPSPLIFNFSSQAVSFGFQVASPTKNTRHSSITGDVEYLVQTQAVLNYHHGIVGSVSYGFSVQGDILYSSNTGGRLTLVATTNYEAPAGGAVYLQVTAGTMIIGFERAPTATLSASLSGATIVTEQQPDSVASTALLEGSVIATSQSDDVVSVNANSSGAVAFVTEPAPSVVMSGDMLFTVGLSATFTQPYLQGAIAEPENVLKGSWTVPSTTMSFTGEIIDAPFLSLNANLVQPISLMSIGGSDLSLNFTSLAQVPTMAGSLLGQGNFTWVETLRQPTLAGEILAGEILTLFANGEEPTLKGEILFQEFILDMSATGQQATLTATVTHPFGFSAQIAQPTFTLVEADVLALYGEVPTSSFTGTITSGLLLNTVVQVPDILGDISLNGSSNTAWTIQPPTFRGDITGGLDNYLNVKFDAPVALFEILSGTVFSLSGDFYQPAMRGRLSKTNTLNLYGEFPELEFSGGSGLSYEFTGTMPTMLADMRIDSTVIEFQ